MITRALEPLRRGDPTPTSDATPPRAIRTPTLGYLPALDGIRAVAVAGVLVFHSALNWLPGGFLGVDVFFVLSGFLITSLLLHEVETSGRIDFKAFYLRRSRRLLPALLAVLVVTAAIVLLFAHDAGAKFREDAVASLFYVTNWWNILGEQSYFEAIGRPPLLQHLWSLGIEEQFYLIWPAVMLFAFRRGGRDRVRKFALIGALASTFIMFVLSFVWSMPSDNDPSRLYFGTDTHAMTILVGAALATAWRPRALPKTLSLVPKMVLTAIGFAALGLILWSFASVTEDSTLLYRGGFLAFAALCAVLIAVFTHPAIAASKILAVAPLVYLGKRSYGLYLWHWPIFMVTRPGVDIGMTGVPAFALQLVFTFAAAELSYRYLEMPVRNGAIKRVWNDWRRQGRGVAVKRGALVVTSSALLLFGLVAGVSALPAPSADDYLGGATAVGAGNLAADAQANPVGTPTGTVAGESAVTDTGSANAVGAMPKISDASITAVGDSVMLGSRKFFASAMPGATIDAQVSRQAAEVFARIDARRAAGQLEPVVVIHTGTNGPVEEESLRAALNGLSDRQRVVLVTAHLQRSWVDDSNAVIRSVASSFPNVRVADWATLSDGQKRYFVYDGVHLTEAGAEAYARLVGDTVNAP